MHFGDHVEALGDSLGGLGDAFGVLWELLGTRWWLLGTSRDTGGTFQIMFGHFVQPLRKHCKNQWFSKVLKWDSVHCGHTLGLLGTL